MSFSMTKAHVVCERDTARSYRVNIKRNTNNTYKRRRKKKFIYNKSNSIQNQTSIVNDEQYK